MRDSCERIVYSYLRYQGGGGDRAVMRVRAGKKVEGDRGGWCENEGWGVEADRCPGGFTRLWVPRVY